MIIPVYPVPTQPQRAAITAALPDVQIITAGPGITRRVLAFEVPPFACDYTPVTDWGRLPDALRWVLHYQQEGENK